MKDCVDACSRTKNCAGAVHKKKSQKCWLKSSIGKVSYCADSAIIYRVRHTRPTTTSRQSTTTSCKSSSTSTTKSPSPTSTTSSSTTTTSRSTTSSQTTTTSSPFQPDATFCSCIASTPTNTISTTPSTTSTIIISSTASPVLLTATNSQTTYITPTSTSTITPTTTYTASISTSTISSSTTTTQTTNLYPTSGPGPSNQQGTCNCDYTVRCGLTVDPSVSDDFFLAVTPDSALEACQAYCDEVSTCGTAVIRTRSDGALICYTYNFYTNDASSLVQDSSAITFAKQSGSCRNLGGQCCKQNYNSLIAAYQYCYV